MSAPRLKVLDIELFERPFRLRMPFRFGVTTATHGRQAIARVRIATEGGTQGVGFAAEALGAKWFDKNMALTDAQNHSQLRKSIEIAGDAYLAAPPRAAFDLFAGHYAEQLESCGRIGLNPLIASYGPALLDRAVLDGLCRAHRLSFYQALRANLPGIRAEAISPDLAGFDMSGFLGGLTPANLIHVRHTVGLVDPITRADQQTRIDDGLPETLEEVVEVYGNRYFKLKVGGDKMADLERLRRIAAVLERCADPYWATLDGNEQYADLEGVTALWRAIEAEPGLARLAKAVLFIEQPIKRDVALSEPVGELGTLRPVIIDESDGDLDAFPRAWSLGYSGVSSKTCKGIYKSVLNLARCRHWTGSSGRRLFLSAEDLTTQPGLSVQQDLALVNLLGLGHVERNAHHFIDGFAGQSDAEASAYLVAHPGLYHRRDGRVRLRIEAGRIDIGSLDCVGFASRVAPDIEAAEPMPKAQWFP